MARTRATKGNKGNGKTKSVSRPVKKPPAKEQEKTRFSVLRRRREGMTLLDRIETEVWGLGIALMGLLILFALVSFRPEDVHSLKVENVIGPVGAWLAFIVFFLTGFCGYVLALGSIYLGALLIAQRVMDFKKHHLGGFAVILVPGMILLAMIFPDQSLLPKGGGGIIGLVVSTVLEDLIHTLGTVLLALGGVMAGISLMFRIPVRTFFTAPIKALAGLIFGRSKAEVTTTVSTPIPVRVLDTMGDGSIPVTRQDEDATNIAKPENEKVPAEPDLPAGPVAEESQPTSSNEELPSVRDMIIEAPEAATVPEVAPEGTRANAPVTLSVPPRDAEGKDVAEGKDGHVPAAARKGKKSKVFEIPALNMLQMKPPVKRNVDDDTLQEMGRLLVEKLADFKVDGEVVGIHPGPVITLFEFRPGRGIKVSQVANLSKDLAMAMAAEQVRVIAPIPGKDVVGIEIPNKVRETVYLRELLANRKFQDGKHRLPLALGKDIAGFPLFADLTKMPHLLVAGTTGSGKSVLLHSFIMSVLFKLNPSRVKFLFVDTKMLELTAYSEIPHLLLPVVTEAKHAALALRWAVGEMERRNRLMSAASVPNVAEFNELVRKRKDSPEFRATIKRVSQANGARQEETVPGSDEPQELPYIVVVIDELADLMMVAGKEVESSIARLAQMARAAGIHMIIATQNPTIKVVTGIIKANMPSRISAKVRTMADSRVILDQNGADDLLGYGDMLFLPPGSGKLQRIHGALVTTEERLAVVDYLRKHGAPEYHLDIADLRASDDEELPGLPSGSTKDDLYEQAKTIAISQGKISTSALQRHLGIGYNKAAKLMMRMEQEGLVGPPEGAGKPRVVLA